jgi:cytochrome c
MTNFRIGGVAIAAATLLAGGAAQAQASGEQMFKQRCGICHKVKAGEKSPLGPHLAGVVGRKAGTGAFSYSTALKASKLVWNPATLDKYLAAPSKLVPGTRMAIAVSDAAQRKAIIGYLATIR